MRFDRLLNRGILVFGHTASQVLPALASVLSSLLVIRFASVSLWGEYVYVAAIFSIAMSIAGWGNKEFLLQVFSREPRNVDNFWRQALLTRLPLLAFLPAVLLLFTDLAWQGLLIAGLWGAAVFVHQSFDALVIFYKRFTFSATVEAAVTLAQLGVIFWLRQRLSLALLLLIFACSPALKAMVFAGYFRRQVFGGWRGSFTPAFLSDARLFFLLTLAGMLEVKVDILCVNYFLPKSDVGRYQVLIMFLIYLKNAGFFLTMPFVKNIYRMPETTLRKVRKRLFGWGLPLLLTGIAVVWAVLTHIYQLRFEWEILVLGYLFAVPHLLYVVDTYALIRASRERVVLLVSVCGIGVNLLLNVLFIPHLGLKGAMLAGAVTQWVILVLYQNSGYFGGRIMNTTGSGS